MMTWYHDVFFFFFFSLALHPMFQFAMVFGTWIITSPVHSLPPAASPLTAPFASAPIRTASL